jgi:translation initiation factor IF-2
MASLQASPDRETTAFQQQPRVAALRPPSTLRRPHRPPPRPAQRSGVVLRTLTAEEKEARDRALAGARVREAEDRKRQEEEAKLRTEQEQREHLEREAAAKRKAEEEARHKAEEEASRKAEDAARKLAPKSAAADRMS